MFGDLANNVIKALSDANSRFVGIIESMSEGFFTLDEHLTVIYFNKAASTLFGKCVEEVIGRNLLDALPAVRGTVFEEKFREALAMRRFLEFEAFLGVAPYACWFKVRICPFEECVSVFFHDVTARVEAEARHLEQQRQLAHANKMIALGTLVAGVGHEINNPASFITLNAPLLKMFLDAAIPVLDEHVASGGDFAVGKTTYLKFRGNVPKLVEGVLDGGKRITRIVSTLKDFARPDEGEVLVDVDVNALIAKAMEFIGNHIAKLTHRFSFIPAVDLPHLKTARPHQLEQVLINVVLNALQALPDPDRAVEVVTQHDGAGDRILVKVRDEGCGIKARHIEQITDPFFTTKRTSGGTGLGLAISSQIIEGHGGQIAFESVEGKGTMVSISLPVEGIPPQAARQSRA